MQNLRFKAKITVNSNVINYKKALTMKKSCHILGNNFNKLYFHAKSQVKRKQNKNQAQYATEKIRSGNVESKIGELDKI